MGRLKEIGLIAGYLWLVLAYYFFDWDAWGILFSFSVEIVALLIIYTVARIVLEIKKPKLFKKQQPLPMVIMSGILLLVFQTGILYITLGPLYGGDESISSDFLFQKEIIFALCLTLLFHTTKLVRIKGTKKKEKTLRESIILHYLLLTGANVFCVLLVSFVNIESMLVLISIAVGIRITIELYFFRKLESI